MPLFEERDERRLYPSCVSKIKQPLDVSAAYSWKDVCAYCMGGSGSGLSGSIVNGWLICSGDASSLNAWVVTPPF